MDHDRIVRFSRCLSAYYNDALVNKQDRVQGRGVPPSPFENVAYPATGVTAGPPRPPRVDHIAYAKAIKALNTGQLKQLERALRADADAQLHYADRLSESRVWRHRSAVVDAPSEAIGVPDVWQCGEVDALPPSPPMYNHPLLLRSRRPSHAIPWPKRRPTGSREGRKRPQNRIRRTSDPQPLITFAATLDNRATRVVAQADELPVHPDTKLRRLFRTASCPSFTAGKVPQPTLMDTLRGLYYPAVVDEGVRRPMTEEELVGFEEYYTTSALLSRDSIRFHPYIQMFTKAIWETCVVAFGLRMTKQAYMTLFGAVLDVLPQVVYVEHPEVTDAPPSKAFLHQDWERDSQGDAVLGFPQFAMAWFQLADVWTTEVNAHKYALFMQAVQNAITTTDAGGRLEFKFSTKHVRRYITARSVKPKFEAVGSLLKDIIDPPPTGFRDPRLLRTLRRHQSLFDAFITRWKRARMRVMKRSKSVEKKLATSCDQAPACSDGKELKLDFQFQGVVMAAVADSRKVKQVTLGYNRMPFTNPFAANPAYVLDGAGASEPPTRPTTDLHVTFQRMVLGTVEEAPEVEEPVRGQTRAGTVLFLEPELLPELQHLPQVDTLSESEEEEEEEEEEFLPAHTAAFVHRRLSSAAPARRATTAARLPHFDAAPTGLQPRRSMVALRAVTPAPRMEPRRSFAGLPDRRASSVPAVHSMAALVCGTPQPMFDAVNNEVVKATGTPVPDDLLPALASPAPRRLSVARPNTRAKPSTRGSVLQHRPRSSFHAPLPALERPRTSFARPRTSVSHRGSVLELCEPSVGTLKTLKRVSVLSTKHCSG